MSPGQRAISVVSIPDIRDYARINAELVRQLDAGSARVRLVGAAGHRLLAAGLSGSWSAVIEIEGDAGPELAAELDAPGLVVVCRGSSGDGAGRGLKSGRLVILGGAGDALGYTQAGGTVVASGQAGHRPGLDLAGGTLLLLGHAGRLVAERQSGGLIFAYADCVGRHPGFSRRGGRLVLFRDDESDDPGDVLAFQAAMHEFTPWLGSHSR